MSDRLAIEGGKPMISNLNYKRWPFYSSDVEEVILARIRSGDIYATEPDPIIEELESLFIQKYCPGHYALFCASGTAALFSAYFSLGLDYGAEVLVPSNTFRATVTPLLLLNLRPVLCDSDPVTGGIDLDDAEQRITKRTQALVVTHLWGHPVDMTKAKQLADKYNIALVEDCSHAHGSSWQELPVGTVGNVSVFSLGTKKMVSGGIAGILITKDSTIYERALAFGQPKPRAKAIIKDEKLRAYLGTGFGANLRGSPIAAALAIDHLNRLPETISIKNKNLLKLSKALQDYLPDLVSPTRKIEVTSGTWYAFYCSWTNQEISRDLILRALQAEGVLVSKPDSLLHQQILFADPSPMTSYKFDKLPMCSKTDYPNSNLIFERLIGWQTREMYELADETIASYALAFEKIQQNLHKLIMFNNHPNHVKSQ
jgi:perosamine synthetase